MEDITSNKFKANPYNFNNTLVTENDIINIMKQLNINDFTINNLALYQQSFIHKSYCHMKDYEEYSRPNNCLGLFDKSYETLEFLGDSLLGSCVATYLYERYATHFKKDEGFLTKLKIRLVNGEQLSYLSDKLGFSKFIIISNHIETNCQGRENIHILEDVLEAFIGSLLLDTNSYDIVNKFIIHLLEENIDFSDLIMKDNNYKDQILRYFQHNFKIYPTYIQKYKNEDTNLFVCDILKETEIISNGSGLTKKKSEQDASKNALIFYGVISE